MNKLISISIFLITLTVTAVFANEQKAGNVAVSLTVIIEGFSNDKGNAMIALCNTKEGFKNTDKAFNVAAASIKGGKAEWIFSNIPFGTYAVKVYHDENSNMKLDTGAFGIPMEKYGFSNNVRGNFGPPKYEEAQFTFNKTNMTITISVK